MRQSVLAMMGALILMTGVAQSQTLHGTAGAAGAQAPAPDFGEVLQVGDFVPEFGIGCSNGAGTAGGPNELALGVTATAVPATFYLKSVSYNLFTQISPNITSLQFVTWAGGASIPGASGNETSVPFAQGFNTVHVSMKVGARTAPGGHFFIGLEQKQSTAGLRAGVDSSSGSAKTSYIRAATCGAAAFTLLDTLGFLGNWVIRAVALELIPVELMTFEID